MGDANSEAARRYRETPLPSGHTPWREVTFSVVDLETTGLDPSVDEIISWAAITVSGGRVTLADVRYRLVRPDRMPEADTIKIHGLREADLSGAPPLSEQLGSLLESFTGRVLVAHVAEVERVFLGAALSKHGLELRNPIVDTARLDSELRSLSSRRPPAESEPIGLSEMARELGLPAHRPHHADGDALTTAQAFIALATHLEAVRDPLTLDSLLRTGGQTGGYRRSGPIRRLIQRLGLGAGNR